MRLFGLSNSTVTSATPDKQVSNSNIMAPKFELCSIEVSQSIATAKNNNEDDIEVAGDALIENVREFNNSEENEIDCETKEALSALDDYLNEFRRPQSEVEDMRNKILDHLEDLGDEVNEYYNQCDIDWLLNPKKPHQIERFLMSAFVSQVDAFDLICKCLLWRKESNIMFLKDSDFPSEFYSKGGLFRYETDVTGTPLIYMRIKMVKKYPELDKLLKQFVAYQISRLDASANDGLCRWGIVFDCSDIGFANVQIDMLKYLITVLKDYFPAGVKYVLVYDLPWLLSAVQKMVFAMIPEEAKRQIFFKTKKNVTQLIPRCKLPDYMGGHCTTNYRAVPDGCLPFKILHEGNYSKTQLDKMQRMLDSV